MQFGTKIITTALALTTHSLLCLSAEEMSDGPEQNEKESLDRAHRKEELQNEPRVVYVSANGTDSLECWYYTDNQEPITPCRHLGYIMYNLCNKQMGQQDKITVYVLGSEIPIVDCTSDYYLSYFNYLKYGPQCDLDINGINDGDKIPIFSCLNMPTGRQSLQLLSRHTTFNNWYDYYYYYNGQRYEYESMYDYGNIPMPTFMFRNLKFVGIIIDLTSIEAIFDNVIFENSMIQHFAKWDFDCHITFESCIFRRTRDDVANFGYPQWVPDYVKHYKSMSGKPWMAPIFRDGFLLGPWPHSPIFMERCKSVKFSLVNTTWTSGSIAIFYQQNAEINITDSSFTNTAPFQTFIWIDDFSLMYFEMFNVTQNYYGFRTRIGLSNILFKDIHNDMTNVPNVFRITSKSTTTLHVSDSVITNSSGFLYAHLAKPHSVDVFGEILFTDISFIENLSPTGLVKFSDINWAHVKIRNCIFKNNQAIEPEDTRVLKLYNGNEFYLPSTGNGVGGAIYIDETFLSFKIVNCSFLNNISPRGGGSLHVAPGGGGWQKIIEVQDSSFECCDTTIKLQSGYILSAESGLKLTNVTIDDHYMTKGYVPSILFKSIFEPLSMSNTYLFCPKGNEIERNVKDTKAVMHYKGFARYDVACMSCSYPSFNNEPLHASYYGYEHESDHDQHNQSFSEPNTMNVVKYYPKARIIEELENTKCSTGNCPFGAICEGLLTDFLKIVLWSLCCIIVPIFAYHTLSTLSEMVLVLAVYAACSVPLLTSR